MSASAVSFAASTCAGPEQLRYDFELDPGVDPSVLEMEIRGARRIGLAPDGSLELETPAGKIRQSRPVAWQQDGDRRVPVDCRFTVSGNRVAFSTGVLDPELRLIVDPTIELEFLENGGSVARGYAAAVDDQGNPLIAGETTGTSFPTKDGLDSSFSGSRDLFAAKFEAGGSTLLWSTYVGGIDGETLYGMALGPDDSVFLCGYTGTSGSADAWPVKNAFQSTPGGGARDSPREARARRGQSGLRVPWAATRSTTSRRSCGRGRAGAGRGLHELEELRPLVDPIYASDQSFESDGDNTGFLAKVSATGSTLLASTYLGPSTAVFGIAVDGDGEVWVVGVTASDAYFTYQPLQASLSGTSDAHIMKVSASHEFVLFSTFFGGNSLESARGVAVGEDGDAFVVGFTVSDDFPEVNSLPGDPALANAFVLRIDGETLELQWATKLGGSSYDEGYAVALDGAGGVVVAGWTQSSDFPTVHASGATYAGQEDFFVSRLTPDGAAITFSTYYGQEKGEVGTAVATDGAVIVAHGYTREQGINAVAASFRIMFEDLTVTATSGDSVDLAWNEPHSGPFEVEIERRSGAGAWSGVAMLDAGATAWSDPEVDEETPYQYRVRGVATGGVTAWATTAAATNPPLSPGDLQANATSNNSVSLAWTDRTSLETAYEVHRRTEPGGVFAVLATLPTGAESYVDETAAPDAVYTYSVGARGASGALGLSEAIVSMPPADLGVFSAVAISDVEVQLSWTDLSSTESGFEVQRRDDSAGGVFQTIETTAAGQTALLDGAVEGDHDYSYRCRGVSANGVSGWSTERSLQTPPRAPSDVEAASPTPERIALSWTDESGFEIGFRIESRLVGAAQFLQVAIRPAGSELFEVGSLLQETAYEFRVQAFNEFGSSRWVETQAVSTPSQLTIQRAKLTPAKGARPARLTVAGTFDIGTSDLDLAAPATVRVGESVLSVPGFAESGRNGLLRYETDEWSVVLRPSRSGASVVRLEVRAVGPVADAVDGEGTLRVSFESGQFRATGGARLDEGRFDLRAGRGSLETPTLALTSFRAIVKTGTPHSFALGASFPPQPVNVPPPGLTVSVGDYGEISFPQNRFIARGSRWVLSASDLGSLHAVYDPARGRLTLKVGGLDLGEFREGDYPVHLSLTLSSYRFEDTPVLHCDGRRLGP